MLVKSSTLYEWLSTTDNASVQLTKWRSDLSGGELLGQPEISEGFAGIVMPDQLKHASEDPQLPNYRFILELDEAIIVQPQGFLVTPDLQALEDSYLHRIFEDGELEQLNESQLMLEYLPGRNATILSNGWWYYFHWMFHILPRARLLQQAKVPYEQLLTNKLVYPFQLETLERIGVDLGRVRECQDGVSYQCEKLYFPSFCHAKATVEKDVIQWLQHFYQPRKRASRDRLYISRGQALERRLVNEEELLPILEQYGFEILKLEVLTLQEQVDRLGNASIVLGPTGGGFTNLIYAQPDTRVIEIHHDHFQFGFFAFLTTLLGMSHTSLLGDTIRNDRPLWPWNADIYLPPEKLESFLKNLG